MTDNVKGLTQQEVEQRIKEGKVNGNTDIKTKSIKTIVKENVFTFFNFLNIFLALLVVIFGNLKNAMFLGVIVCNTAIGIFQEIRSKKTIDKLTLISAPKAHVVRDGIKKEIPTSEVVLDDLMMFDNGVQAVADCQIVSGECEVNESLITGESDPINKKAGDQILSGSFVVSGQAQAVVTALGEDSFANKITNGAKYVKKNESKMLKAINVILKVISICVFPLLIGLLVEGICFSEEPSGLVVVSSVGAIVGMIPEGLVLLTSVVLAVSALRLAKQKTLVQDLNCIETLARVDVLCLDKTGTITEGKMYVEDVMTFDGYTADDVDKAISFVTSSLSDTNPTFFALKDKWNKPSDIRAETICPFSSAKKWSGAYSSQCGSYIIGAGEFILREDYAQIKEKAEQFSQNGRRVILLAHSDDDFCDKELPQNIRPIALVAICDKIRDEAPDTLKYFEEQGVDIKIISGDNPSTVSAISMKAGVKNGEKYIDASTVQSIGEYVDDYTVFGRVTPDQKLELIKALKAKGRTVGMTGDGVNDVLALKEADCSIAMQSGSESARNVSNFVLLDSNFASMPKVVAEGRRSINNVERSASLFLSKTVYNFITAFIFVLMGQAYLFQPIQMTLINALCIGIPSFMLALEPNKSLVKGTFISNVMRKALPNGITVTLAIMLVVLFGSIFGFSTVQMSSIATIVLGVTSFAIVLSSCKPFKPWMAVMITFCASAFFIGTFMFASFFEITYFTFAMILCTIIASAWGLVLMWLLNKASDVIVNKFNEYKKTRSSKAVG